MRAKQEIRAREMAPNVILCCRSFSSTMSAMDEKPTFGHAQTVSAFLQKATLDATGYEALERSPLMHGYVAWAKPWRSASHDPYSFTMAKISTSTKKSGCDSRLTSTAVLVDRSSPQNSIRASIFSK